MARGRKPKNLNDIEQAKEFGRQSLEDAKAGKLDRVVSSNEVQGFAEIPRLEDTSQTQGGSALSNAIRDYDYARQEYAKAMEQFRRYQDFVQDQNASRNAQRRAETGGKSEVLGTSRKQGEKSLTAKAQHEIDSIDREISSLERSFTGDAGVDETTNARIDALKRKRESINKAGRSKNDYLVTREDYEDRNSDPEFAKDLGNLTDIIYNPRKAGGAATANAMTESLTGMSNAQDYIAHLSEKYGYSEKELRDMAKTRHADDKAQNSAKAYDKVSDYAEDHPVLGSIASLFGTLGQAAEGAYNIPAGFLTNDDRNSVRAFNSIKKGFREGAKENLSNEKRIARLKANGADDRKIAALENKSNSAAQNIYDIGMGLVDLGVGALTGNAPLVLAGNTANEAYLNTIDKGQSARKAAIYGGASGVADYYFNKVGLDKAKDLALQSVKASGVPKLLANMGIAGLGEAGENLLQDISQTFLDEFINKDYSDIRTSFADKIENGMDATEAFKAVAQEYAMDRVMSAATGFVMGAGMMGGSTLKNEVDAGIINHLLKKNSKNVWDKVEEAERNKVPAVEEQLNPVEMAQQNEIDVPKVEEQQARALEEIQKLAEQIPTTPETERDPFRWGRTADTIIPADSYARDQGYIDRDKHIAELSGKEEALRDRMSELYKELDSETLDKPESEWDTNDGIISLLGERPTKYTERGQQIQDEIRALRKEIDALREESDALVGERDYTRAQQRLAQLEGYEQNEFVPAQREQYQGFSTKKGILNDQIESGRARLVEMSPEEYIRRCAYEIFGSDMATIESVISSREQNLVDKYAQMMREGVEFDTPYLDYTSMGQEGLHRALAAKEADIDVMPVVVKGDPESGPALGYDAQKYISDTNLRKLDQRLEELDSEDISDDTFDDIADNTSFEEDVDNVYADEVAAEIDNLTAEELDAIGNLSDEDLVRYLEAHAAERKGGDNLPPTTPPEEGGGNPPSKKMGRRRTYTNTGLKSGVVDPYDLENNPVTMRDAEYEIHSNKDISEQAKENVDKNGDMLVEQYASGTKEIDSDLDMDQSMILLHDDTLSTWTKDSILRNLAEHGTKAGQFIQAFRKWANTAVGALAKATQIDSETVKDWTTNNKKLVKANEDLSSKLKQAIDNITDYSTREPGDPKTLPIIRQEVANTIDAYKKTWIADMNKVNEMMGDDPFEFSGEDIDYLAHMIDHGATVKELKDALNMKLATGRFGITAETQSQVNRLFEYAKEFDQDSQEFCEAQAEAFRLLAEEVAPKASALEKFDTWRYMAMLGNPKTMLRNYVGNKLFSAVTGASNNLAAAIEHGVDWAYYKKTGEHIQRTKEFLNPFKDKGLIDGAANFAKNTAWRSVEGTKYEKMDKESLKNSRSAFDSDLMRIMEKAIDKGISDTNAVIKKFSTSMAGYMKANGLGESAFDDAYRFRELERDSKVRLLDPKESAEMERLRPTANAMDKAREYALKQAEYATFHEDNAVADALTKASRYTRNSDHAVVRGMGYALEGTIPFKKTPANILRSGFEYSPFGALKSIAETGKLIYENTGSRKGNLEDEYTKTGKLTGRKKTVQKTLAADVIDSWSKTLTGSGLALLGYYLFNKGILTSSDKGEKYQDQLEGKGNYAININGHTYTLDWAAPGVMPLLTGAEINKVIKSNGKLDEEWYSNPDRWLETINGLLDPMLETSMLSGLKDTLQTAANEVRYNEENALGGILGSVAGNTLTGYMTQAIPTLSGQIARTIDPTRRTTDTYNEGILGTFEKQGRKIMNKIPGLSMLNPEYRDARGEGQLNGLFDYEKGEYGKNIAKGIGNLAYQTLSPGYYSKINQTDADRLGRDLYGATDENGNYIPAVSNDEKVFADWRSTKKIDGIKLDPKQMQTFREEMGTANEALREGIYNSEWYRSITPETQKEVVDSLNSIADKIGQYSVMPDHVKVSGTLKTYLDAGGGDNGIQAIIDELEADHNPYGLNKDTYTQMKADGEDFSKFIGYGDILAETEATDKKAYREAWLDGGEDALRKAIEAGDYIKESGTSANSKVAEAINEAVASGDTGKAQEIVDSTVTLQSLGLDKPSPAYTYQKAAETIPGLTVEQFAQTYKSMDADNNQSLKQVEIVNYLNSSHITNEIQGMQLWNAYGSSTWKKIPVLEDGEWRLKSK